MLSSSVGEGGEPSGENERDVLIERSGAEMPLLPSWSRDK